MSLDGYIAAPGDNLDFLSLVEKEGEDYGYKEFIDTIDTVILGRRTYDKIVAMGHEYPNTVKNLFVVTRSERPATGKVTYYNGDLGELVNTLKIRDGKNIYCDGGAEIVHLLMMSDLIDELTVSVIPVLLGGGTALFKPGFTETGLELLNSRTYDTGLVQLHYRKGSN